MPDVRSAAIPDHVSWTDVGTDLVVFNAADSTYYAFDGVASDIWRALTDEDRLDAVAAVLRSRYDDADAGAIERDVAEFVADAARRGLLVVDAS